MDKFSKKIFRADLLIPIALAATVTYFASNLVDKLKIGNVQPIASTVATVSGILFGFVMASVTLLASAKENTLVKNTQKTQYLPDLVARLHRMMGWLLFVCIIFLSCLFIQDDTAFNITRFNISFRYISLLIDLGVFVFSLSIFKFIFIWKEFSKFVSNM